MAGSKKAGGILEEFEQEYHAEIIRWVEGKLPKNSDLRIFDLSIDSSFFSTLIAEKVAAKRLVVGKWHPDQKIVDEHFKSDSYDVDIAAKNGDGFNGNLGRFDVVILREILHEAKDDLKGFFEALKPFLDENGEIIVLTRPKNPPIPLPDSGSDRWRKTALTREEILESAQEAGYTPDCYAVSCPVKVPKAAYGAYLRGRYIAALHGNDRCSDREINEFIRDKPSPFFEFEEKILIIVLHPRKAAEANHC